MKKLTLFIVLLSLALSATAIPARRASKVVKQSDGTELTVSLVGDESFHYYITTDGMPLVREVNGDFSYARLTADGRIVTMGTIAHNVAQRSQQEHALVASAKANGLHDNLSKVASRRSERYNAPRRKAQTIRPEGIINVPVLLVEFADEKFRFKKEDLELNFNGVNYKGPDNPFTDEVPGSLRDYFIAQSDGKFMPNFIVTDIITLDKNMKYYGGNDSDGSDKNPQLMIKEACKAADANFDFSIFDNNGDGEIEFLYCVYAGYAEAAGAPEETIWPHQWHLSSHSGTITLDGVKIDNYACSSELSLNADLAANYGVNLSGIGSCCHEFSHCLGLPDFYDTSNSDDPNFGMDYWDLMDYGCYNAEGYVPIGYSAYERDFVGWLELPELTERGHYSMDAINAGGHGYKIVNEANPSEYYIIENRQQTGWDRYIFNSGMLITHVDYLQSAWYNNTVNKDKNHQRYTLIPADGKLTTYTSAASTKEYTNGLKGDIWPGTSNNTELTDTSTPAAKVFKGGYMGKSITKIKNENGVVTFSFMMDDLTTPELLEPSGITTSGFTAHWTEDVAATAYIFTLEKLVVAEDGGDVKELLSEDFTAVSSNNLALASIINSYTNVKGWSAKNIYSANGAVRIGAKDKVGSITTPEFDVVGDASVSFRVKTVDDADDAAKLDLTILDSNGNIIKTLTYTVTSSYVSHSLDFSVKDAFTATFSSSASNVLIDDIKLSATLPFITVPVMSQTVESTSLTLTDLEAGAEYRYNVRSTNGVDVSEASEYGYVKLLTTGISDVMGNSDDVKIYDLTGRQVENPGKGIYVIRTADTTKKIYIK